MAPPAALTKPENCSTSPPSNGPSAAVPFSTTLYTADMVPSSARPVVRVLWAMVSGSSENPITSRPADPTPISSSRRSVAHVGSPSAAVNQLRTISAYTRPAPMYVLRLP